MRWLIWEGGGLEFFLWREKKIRFKSNFAVHYFLVNNKELPVSFLSELYNDSWLKPVFYKKSKQ